MSRDGGTSLSGKSRAPTRGAGVVEAPTFAELDEVVDQPVGGLVAVVGLLLQEMHDDLRQRLGPQPD